MRRTQAAALLVLAGILAGGAQARPSDDARVIPGVGIGKVRLGMTEGQVRKAMGAPLVRQLRKGPFGRTELVLQYGLSAYTVVLGGSRPATRRVNEVATGLASERTPHGHGFGTPERVLAERYGAELRCERLPTLLTREGRVIVDTIPNPYRNCAVPASGAETVFRTTVRVAWSGRLEEWRDRAEVVEVIVRAA